MKLQHFKKQLRQEQTNAKNRLWYFLRDRRFQGRKFRRQVQIGFYIVDFICQRKSLIIECDGGQHDFADVRRSDQTRTAFLQREGYRILRFWNNEIFENIYGVLTEIEKHLTPSPELCSTSPTEGRGDL